MTPIEKARAALAKERARKEEFYEGAVYALKLAEAAQVGGSETPKTNGDRVRAMSDEELTKLFFSSCRKVCVHGDSNCCTGTGAGELCRSGMLAWLRQEA